MGDDSTDPANDPRILPQLQNRSVINVIIGDYHYGALTSDGKLYTWGAYSNGALGLGDPRSLPAGAPGGYSNTAQDPSWSEPSAVQNPTEVHFTKNGLQGPGKKFVFAAAAAGWHTGALVIDLEVRPDIRK
jgi:SCF-associated factor 1